MICGLLQISRGTFSVWRLGRQSEVAAAAVVVVAVVMRRSRSWESGKKGL